MLGREYDTVVMVTSLSMWLLLLCVKVGARKSNAIFGRLNSLEKIRKNPIDLQLYKEYRFFFKT